MRFSLIILILVWCLPAYSHGENKSEMEDPPLLDFQQTEEDSDTSHVLSRPWWENFDLYGFAGVGYYDTGRAGTRDNGAFEIKEASLFLEAEIWDETTFFLELQTNRLGKDDQLFTRTGEVYVHFREVVIGDYAVGFKIGRLDIPFGEEYLWQDAIDNPLITNSAAYPYGWDEGILIYGEWRRANWIFSITDGSDERSADTNSEKAFNAKLYGYPIPSLYASLSLMSNGSTVKSAIEFGGSHFQPIGASLPSTVGASNSAQVDAKLAELALKYEFPAAKNHSPYLAFSVGTARQEDDDVAFERDIHWFSVEPYFEINNHVYLVARYSEIGTYDDNQGFHFDGKIYAGGNAAFGDDVRRFRRASVGVGWQPNPHVRAKLEIAKDRFYLINPSPLLPLNGQRGFIGLEIAVGF